MSASSLPCRRPAEEFPHHLSGKYSARIQSSIKSCSCTTWLPSEIVSQAAPPIAIRHAGGRAPARSTRSVRDCRGPSHPTPPDPMHRQTTKRRSYAMGHRPQLRERSQKDRERILAFRRPASSPTFAVDEPGAGLRVPVERCAFCPQHRRERERDESWPGDSSLQAQAYLRDLHRPSP